MSTKTDDAKKLFLAWLAREQPLVFARTVAVAKKTSLDRRLSGLGDLSGWLDTLVGAAVTVGGTLIAKKQADQAASLQKKQQASDLQLALLGVNTQRAQAGFPPVDINGNVIPSAALPMPAALNRSELLSASTADYLPWVIGAGAVSLGVFLVIRGR
jgi:hypothetical protein